MPQTKTPTKRSLELRERVFSHRDEIAALAKEYGVKNVRLFGSTANGDAESTSDIDLLVDNDGIRTYFQIGRLQCDLCKLLGTEVDLIFSDTLKPYVREAVEEGELKWVC